MNLVDSGGQRAIVPLLVEDQAGVDGAWLAVQGGHHLFGARHLRHELGVDEARRLHALQSRGGEPVAQLGANGRIQGLGLVLETITRSDVADGHGHIDKVGPSGGFAATSP